MVNSVTDKDWLLIGRIVGAHGLNGYVKVYPESDFPERFVEPGERWLEKPGAQPTAVKLTSGRYLEGKNTYLVKLAGFDFRDQAEDLRGSKLMVPAGDRLPLDPGEFHVDDLIGLSVVLQSNQTAIGTITNVFTTGHDLLEVSLPIEDVPSSNEPNQKKSQEDPAPEAATVSSSESENHPSLRAKAAQKLRRKAKRAQKKKRPKTLLIPFVKDIVPVVDVASGHVEITPPAGLLDLA
ncbi:ribosome maturation factor RimM [cf. Phormidesmis sp. LEGE 11477]|uniref:ribosome maturation factor RimM n=1 Tax=cf. Phormidesmis sp. LEGE 11477 TaxID=1828680 RepID=UPI00187FF169|nr:ribosome maturation factor RimM [cf. Phormidesmis sp. LEGE 11477]MBE9060548.1 ribosome maturation factor RimM [cf. Phormidesmis sp. LEGE 11477]